MDICERTFLATLAAAMRGERAGFDEELTEENWQEIFRMAREHKVLPLVFEAVYHLPGIQNAPFLPTLRQQVRQQVMRQTVKTSEFLALNRHLQENGIRPLVVKGIICRNLYPKPDCRLSNDEDVLIPAEQYETCHSAMLSFGMESSEPEEKRHDAYEVPYRAQNSPLYIELHKHLFPPQSQAYGDLNHFFKGVFDRAQPQDIQGETVWTLAPTDHVLYLICHAYKHFLHSGFGIRQVSDLTLYAEHYGDTIDWDRVQACCRRIRAERFAAALLRIGENHLGFDAIAARIPTAWREMEIDETNLLEDLLHSGVYGSAEKSRQHSSTITLTAVENQKQGTRQGGLRKSLFPPAKVLENRYPYLKKHPWLLPAAWLSRIVSYGKESGAQNAAEAAKIGTQRVELLKEYGIL